MPPESSARSDRKYEMSKVGDRVYVNPDRPLETLTLHAGLPTAPTLQQHLFKTFESFPNTRNYRFNQYKWWFIFDPESPYCENIVPKGENERKSGILLRNEKSSVTPEPINEHTGHEGDLCAFYIILNY